jgi:hypothetical protein
MSILIGKQFKKQYGSKFYKFLAKDLKHYNFKYELGLNVDTNKFNPTNAYSAGGLHFTDKRSILHFYNYGSMIGEIEIPDDAHVYIKENKYKTDKLEIVKLASDDLDILEIVKLAHENGCLWSEWTCYCAASNGHLELLKWLHENGCPWDKRTCSYAAERGYLGVLKYAYENGCRWCYRTCSYAARYGHLEVLKYAYANGCRLDKITCYFAMRNSKLEVLKWLEESGSCKCGGKYHKEKE